MIGNYVRWSGQLSKIVFESNGLATIKVIKKKQFATVALSQLQPVKLQIVKKREESKKTSTFPHWG
jgi:hypothetical protein